MGDTKLPATSLPTSAIETQQTIAYMTSECASLFQIKAANVEQVRAWLRPLGVTENSLTVVLEMLSTFQNMF
ncbi:hypothetical protein Pelo_18766 [Pelomyxa schiedti]|nr:hypothetical protein Pelo_18766 [Pelomyxa schiedti]